MGWKSNQMIEVKLRMHMLKNRCKCECTTMDQYGKSNWVGHFVSLHEFSKCTIGNNVEIGLRTKILKPSVILFFLCFFSPNQEDCSVVYVKCLVFLWFSQ
jgi:hypothetical protein